MKKLCDEEKCTGCLACMNVCPKEAISIHYNKGGLMLPKIDTAKCINCGLCNRTCPVYSVQELKKPIKAYAAWNIDDNKHALSSSGGIARAIYDFVIENKGTCFGARFNSGHYLKIVRADSYKELDEFQGSKYVQAIADNSYKLAKKDLDSGRMVAFIGTPCQIAALKSFLKKDYDNLITADLICHGVPSNKYLHDHIEYLEKKKHIRVDNIKFRGVYDFKLALFKEGKLVHCQDRWCDTYFTGFLESLFFRPNCYECRYACSDRVSDITIGDFWGIGEEKTFEKPKVNGVSVVLANTSKGDQFIHNLKNMIYFEERSISEAVNGNSQLRVPSKKHKNYDLFQKQYIEKGFEKAVYSSLKNDIKIHKKERYRAISKKLILKLINFMNLNM